SPAGRGPRPRNPPPASCRSAAHPRALRLATRSLLSSGMLTGFSEVVMHLVATHKLSGGGPDWVEMWRLLEVGGKRAIQHLVIQIGEAAGQVAVVVTADVHCADPEWVVRWDPPRTVGALLYVDGRVTLRQPIVGAAIDPAHLDRVIDAVAYEAARLARGAQC